ncbi:MAG: SurA N-terminal domain-containing protein [Bacteroidia bacterium]
MGAIGKIRERAGLLVGVVFVSLILFVMGDLLTSNQSFLTGSGTTVAVMGGKKIKIQDFEERVALMENNYKINQNKETIDQTTLESLRDQAWQQMLNDEIMGKQQQKAGISVSPEELFDMVQGKNPHQQIKDAFKDPNTGAFNSGRVIQFLKNMDQDETGKTRAQWLAFESAIKDERIGQKYNDMVKLGLYATTEEAKRDYESKNRQAAIRYVQLPYASVADSTVKPSESELKSYYNSHENKYKQEASRKIEYVIFEVVPSDADRRQAEEYIAKLIEPFKTSKDDSSFVSLNADSKPDFAFQKKETLSPILDSVMFSAPIGTVIGLYEENQAFKVSKLMASIEAPDSIKVSHALVSYKGAMRAHEAVTRTKDQARAIADSLLKLAQKDSATFAFIASTVSDDSVSAKKAGDLGWININSPFDKRFKDGAFATGKGKVAVVESDFGFHLVRITDAAAVNPQVIVGTIDRKIEPSTKTYQSYYSKANEFAGKNNTAAAYDKAITDQGLNKRVAENLTEVEKNIAGLESPRELVRWAYKSKKDDISKAYEFGNKFVVAKLVEVKEKGVAPLEQVKDKVQAEVIKDIKAKQFIEKINTVSAGITDINALAAKLGVTAVITRNLTFASPYIQNVGMEANLVGTIFNLKKGQLSKPVKGESGVFVVVVDDFTEPAPVKDYTEAKKQLTQQLGYRSYELFNALKEKANISDNRGKFY